MDTLFWLPFQRLYHQLQTSHGELPQELSRELNDKHFDWLLEGPLRFKPQQQSSRQAIFAPGAKSVTVQGKKLAVQPKLLDATAKLSSLLDLDAFQSHLVVRRWVKETDQEDLLDGLAASQQLQLDDGAMLEVVQYYHQERLCLLRSLQYIQLQGCMGGPYMPFLDKLVKGGLEDRLVNLLRTNVEQQAALLQQLQQPGSRPSSSTAADGGTSADGESSGVTASSSAVQIAQQPAGQLANPVSTELLIGAQQARQEEVVVERCELLVCLLLLYEIQIGVECSSQRVVELARLLSRPLLHAGRSANISLEQLQNTVAVLEQRTQGMQSNISTQVLTQPQQTALLAESLSCTLLLAVMDVPAYLRMVHAAGDGGAGTPLSPDSLPLGGKTRDLDAELCAWPGRVGSVMLLMTWAALTRLMEPYLDLGEGSGETLLGAATQYGLFTSAGLMVQLSQLLLSSSTAQLCRGVILKALCGVATAFELGPTKQNAQDIASLWQLLKLLLQDDAGLCEGVWDGQQQHVHLQPLRALLKETASLFPAISGPYLQLLAYLSTGPVAAAAAYQHLQAECGLVCLHHVSEPGLFSAGGNIVQLRSKLAWNQAPSVSTMLLPAGIQGKVLPMPELLLPQHDPQQWALVNWEVDGTHPSFGQLLLLGRAAHVLHVMEGCMYNTQEPDPALLQDLVIVLAALSAMTAQQPACTEDLLSISVDAPRSITDAAPAPTATPKFTWLTTATKAVQVLSRLANAYSNQATGSQPMSHSEAVQRAVLKGMQHALALLASMAEQKPASVLAALQLLPSDSPGTLTLPASVPLPAVLSAELAPGGAWLAAPPVLLHLPLECQLQDFAATRALLQLLTTFLRQGYVQGAAPALVLTTLLHLLPSHVQWTYSSPADRWLLQADILHVLEASITAGSCLHTISNTELTGLPHPSDVSVTGLAAAVLAHLLNHGDTLLLDSLIPSVDDLEQLQAVDPASPLLPACEQAAVKLLQLMPLLIAAARAVQVDTAFEERLLLGLAGEQLPPATLLTSLLGYMPTPTGTPTLTHQTLRLVSALQDCVLRNQPRTGLSLASILPPSSPAHAALQRMISSDMAQQDPEGLLLSLHVLKGCIPHHPQLLDSMLPAPAQAPAGEQQQQQIAGRKGAGSGKGSSAKQAAGVGALLALLDACLQPQQGHVPDNADEVVCAVICTVATLWQHPSASPRIIAQLRSSSQLWDYLEQCIQGGHNSDSPATSTPGASAAHDTPASPAAQLAAGFAWQIVSLEAACYPRTQLTVPAPTAAAVPRLLSGQAADASGSTSARASPVWAVVDHLLDKRSVHKALLSHSQCCQDLPSTATRMGFLLLALELELGADAVARDAPAVDFTGTGQVVSGPALLAPSAAVPSTPTREGAVLAAQGVEDRVSSASALRQELQPLANMLQQGAASSHDLEQLHDVLLAAANPDHAGNNLGGLTTPPLAALHAKLVSTGAGAALLSCCMRPGLQLLTGATGSAGAPCVWVDAVDADQLATVLGPALCSGLFAAEALQQLLSGLRQHMMAVQAAILTLHAAAALCTVLLHDNAAAKMLLQQPTAAAASSSADGQGPLHGLLSNMLSQHVELLGAWTAKQPMMTVQGSMWGQACQAVCLAGMQQSAQLLLLMLSKSSTTASSRMVLPGSSGLQLGTPVTGSGTAGGMAGVTSMDPGMCITVLDSLVQWLGVSSTMTASLSGAAKQVAGTLARACSVALTLLPNSTVNGPAQPGSSGSSVAAASPDMILLQQKMLAALLPVWNACQNGQLDVDAGLQVLVQMVLRHLQPYEWLPVLQAHMDLAKLLDMATGQLVSGAQHQEEAEARGLQVQPHGLGALRLALLAAQLQEGAAWLHNAGVLPGLTRLAQQLLAAQDSALSEFASVSMVLQPAANMSANQNALVPRPPSLASQAAAQSGRLSVLSSAEYSDTAGAYVHATTASGRTLTAGSCGTWQWSPLHGRWCTLLGFSGSLIRSLGQFMDVEQDAIDLLCVSEARLLLAVLPPAGNSSQPLTLADTAERERALFLLTQLARYVGTWHMARPASLTQFRAAAVSFLAFASQANRSQVNVECPPMSESELQMAGQPTGLPRTEGWFRVCALAASDLLTQPSAPATPPPAGTPSGLMSPASAASTTTCSEFAARLAEAVYTCTHYALVFLQVTAPQVGEGERGSMLGPGWPRAKELAALQDHAGNALWSMVDMPRGPHDPRRVRCAKLLIKVLQSVCDLLDIVGCSANRAAQTAFIRQQLLVVDQALQRGEAVPLPSSNMMARMQSTASTTLTDSLI